MSLTKQDLNAISRLIEASETRIIARIDDLDDVLSMQMENGLLEVRDQIQAVQNQVNGVKTVVDRIDRVQQAELQRNDRQDTDIKQIRKALHAA